MPTAGQAPGHPPAHSYQPAAVFAAQQRHPLAGALFHVRLAAHRIKPIWFTGGPPVGLLQHHRTVVVDGEPQGAPRRQIQRIADLLENRHLAFTRQSGRHGGSPESITG